MRCRSMHDPESVWVEMNEVAPRSSVPPSAQQSLPLRAWRQRQFHAEHGSGAGEGHRWPPSRILDEGTVTETVID